MVSWLIPFVVSYLFVDRSGQPVVPAPLFKSIVLVVLGGIGTMSVIAYSYDIGLRYQLIPIIGVAVGTVAGRAVQSSPRGG